MNIIKSLIKNELFLFLLILINSRVNSSFDLKTSIVMFLSVAILSVILEIIKTPIAKIMGTIKK